MPPNSYSVTCRQELTQLPTTTPHGGATSRSREMHSREESSRCPMDGSCSTRTKGTAVARACVSAHGRSEATFHLQAQETGEEIVSLRQRGGGDDEVDTREHLHNSTCAGPLDRPCHSHPPLAHQEASADSDEMPGNELHVKV